MDEFRDEAGDGSFSIAKELFVIDCVHLCEGWDLFRLVEFRVVLQAIQLPAKVKPNFLLMNVHLFHCHNAQEGTNGASIEFHDGV